jgi:hypothetical protein
MKKILILAILVVILTQINGQRTYDPEAVYNFTYLTNYTYNVDKLQMCAVPSADKTHCITCVNPLLSVLYLGGGVYTFCMLEFPLDECYAFDYCYNCLLCHDGYWLNQTVNDVNFCIPKSQGCLNYDSINKKVCDLYGWLGHEHYYQQKYPYCLSIIVCSSLIKIVSNMTPTIHVFNVSLVIQY